MFRPFIFSLALLAAGDAFSQIQFFEGEDWARIQVAAQDENGKVYAGSAEECRWFSWNENWQPSFSNPWMTSSSSATVGAKPVNFQETADGQVYGIWEKTGDHRVVLQTLGPKDAYLFQPNNEGPGNLFQIFTDSRSNLWTTSAGLHIYETSPFNKWHNRLVYTITGNELRKGTRAKDRLPVSMTEDSRGQIWFWSNCQLNHSSRGSLRGALIADAQGVVHQPELDGLPGDHFSAVAPMEKTNLWIAVQDIGIFSVNPDTFAATRIAEPEPGAFQTVQQLFLAGGQRYVITGRNGNFNEHGLISVLWREHDGHWKKIIDGLDTYGSNEQLATRQRRETSAGLWLGSFGMGGWFVPPDNGEPRQILWQVNSSFGTINRWFQLKDGRMLALQFGRGGFVADAALLTNQPARAATVEIFRPARPFIQTSGGKIFGVFHGNEAALSQWDGQEWKHHPLPKKRQGASYLRNDFLMASDAKERIWLIEADNNPDPTLVPCLIFDPASETFQRYSNFQTALQTQAAALAGSRLETGKIFAAAFSQDGRICYEGRNWKIYYFDGHDWQMWEKFKLVNGYFGGESTYKPFFDAQGTLSLVLNNSLWQFAAAGGWHDTGNPPPLALVANENSLAARGMDVADAQSLVTDRRGISWLIADKQLFRGAFGLRVACFEPSAAEPFADGRKLTQAFADNFGNTFLQTSTHGQTECVLLRAPHPLPETSVKIIDPGAAIPALAWSVKHAAKPRFTWRVDGGPWNPATTNQTLLLDDLEQGKHRVEALGIKESLQTDATPKEIIVNVRESQTRQIQHWIAQLGDADFKKREAAVKVLARHPQTSLPPLQAALDRETAPERRWWLSAAIQECGQSAPQ